MAAKPLEHIAPSPAEDAEETLLTTARLEKFDATRRGVQADDLRDWMLRRREDPAAPCPKAKPID